MIPYTYVNLGLVGYAVATSAECLFPMAFANSVAILASFYAGLAMDPTAKARLMDRYGYSARDFAVNDALAHVLPVALMAYVTRAKRSRVPLGLPSLMLHLAWAAYVWAPSSSFGDLSHVYVALEPWQWRVTWVVAAAAHMLANPVLRALKR